MALPTVVPAALPPTGPLGDRQPCGHLSLAWETMSPVQVLLGVAAPTLPWNRRFPAPHVAAGQGSPGTRGQPVPRSLADAAGRLRAGSLVRWLAARLTADFMSVCFCNTFL